MGFSLALVAGGVALTAATFSQIMSETSNVKLHTMRSMHMVHADFDTGKPEVPKSYLDLDWIMHPNIPRDLYHVNNDVKQDASKSTGMQAWQMSSACPHPREKHQDWLERSSFEDATEQEKAIMCRDEHTHCPVVSAATKTADEILYPNLNMLDVCRVTRMPDVYLFANDPNTWSVASLHSSMVLLFFFGLNLTLLGTYEALRWWFVYRQLNYVVTQFKVMWVQIGFGFLAFVLALIARWNYVVLLSIATDGDEWKIADSQPGLTLPYESVLLHRSVPNGSFLYGLGSVLVLVLFTVRRLAGYEEQGTDLEVDVMDEMPRSAANIRPNPVAAAAPVAAGGAFELSASGFVGKKIPIGAYQVDTVSVGKAGPANEPFSVTGDVHQLSSKGTATLNTDYWSKLEGVKMRQSTWSVLQFVLVPVWLLAAVSSAQGYDVDCDVQTVLLAGFVLCVADVYLDRLTHIANAVDYMEKNMLEGVDMTICLVLVLIQVVLVIVINFTTGWRYKTGFMYGEGGGMGFPEGDVSSITSVNQLGIFLFNFYFGVSALLKLYRSYYHTSLSALKGKNMWGAWVNPKFVDDLLLGVLLVSAVFYGLLMVGYTNGTQNYFSNLWVEHNVKNPEDLQTLQWSGDWQAVGHAREMQSRPNLP